jgi:hypothetical protein
MAFKMNRSTDIVDGEVVVRVGADTLSCPKGPSHPMYPVIELIWPLDAPEIGPRGGVTIRWQDKMDSTKPSKSTAPKYIGLIEPNGRQWVGYRVPNHNRELFESLRKKWGMWFLRVKRLDDGRSLYWTMFNDGGYFPGSLVSIIQEASPDANAAQMRDVFRQAWDDAEQKSKIRPDMLLASDLGRRLFDAISKIPTILEELGGGPLPWVRKEMPWWGKPGHAGHEYVVRMYLGILKSVRQNLLLTTDEKDLVRERAEYVRMYEMIRKARIFEVAAESYTELHNQIDDQAAREAKPGEDVSSGLAEINERLPFPDKLPFRTCWFGLTDIVTIEDNAAKVRGLKGGPYVLIGILVDECGDHHEVLLNNEAERYGDTFALHAEIVTHRIEERDEWLYQWCLAPLILHALVDGINEHQTTIVTQRKVGFQSQGKIKKGLEDLGIKRPIPPPFYTVYLKDQLIHEMVGPRGPGRLRAKYGHRFDVRGHWSYKVHRGQMPIDPEYELHLQKLKYTIFKDGPLDENTIAAFAERELPPRENGEWIAVKKFWKESYVKGPETGPYIPSTRRATKGILAFDNKEPVYEDDHSYEHAKTPAGSKVA